jgi:transposase InsO family protein
MLIKECIESGSQISVLRATQLLSVSRSGFYKWLNQSKGEPEGRDIHLRDEIQKIAVEFPAYGYRRITVELRNRGYTVNHKLVLKLMREDNLLCVRKRFKPKTTDSGHHLRVYPNLVKGLKITRLNQVWASDITYIRLPGEFVYLAVILDLFSRRCVGWNLGRNMDVELALKALNMAIETRWSEDLRGLIHHSDQGVQYASREYIECLSVHGILISMAAQGNPYDNALVESFIRTLKYEEVYLNEYENFSDALDNISGFIEHVYNKKRLHSSIGYRSPIDFEKEVTLNSFG